MTPRLTELAGHAVRGSGWRDACRNWARRDLNLVLANAGTAAGGSLSYQTDANLRVASGGVGRQRDLAGGLVLNATFEGQRQYANVVVLT